MNLLACTLIIGIGATAVTDAWGIVRKPLLAIPFPDYGLVGRWFAHMAHGRFRHDSIAKAAPAAGERIVGWAAHYLTGVAFAGALIAIWGRDWVRDPTPGPAMLVGIVTVLASFLLMQPGMGAGIAASRTPCPGAARFQSLVTHAVFGFGLYAAGWASRLLCSP